MPRIVCSILLCQLALLFSGTTLHAQSEYDYGGFDAGGFDLGGGLGGFGAEQDPVAVKSEFTAATDDRPAVLMVTATIDPGWHVYSITQPKGGPVAAVLNLDPSDQYEPIGNWQSFPEPHVYTDQVVWKGLRMEEHDDQVTWYVPIELAEGVDAEKLTIAGKVSLQACKESCVPLEFKIDAKLGQGVPIGPIKVTTPKNVATTGDTEKPTTRIPTPPENAGVFRAEDSDVTWYAWIDRGTAKPGGRLRIYLRAELPDNWYLHTYAPKFDEAKQDNPPTLIAPETADGFTFYLPELRTPPIEKQTADDKSAPQWFHQGIAVWSIPVDVLGELAPGDYTLSGFLGYQACEIDEQGLGSCELRKGLQFEGQVKIDPTATKASPVTVTMTKATYDQAATQSAAIAPLLKPAGSNLKIIEFNSKGSLGLVGMLGAAFLGGIILNLMPCVLPVIGLKVMGFAKQGGESRARIFTLNLAYVIGLLSVFMLLATLASLPQLSLSETEIGWGELNTQTWFKVSMAALVFSMALSFLGVWEIPIPGFAGSSTASEMASREGYSGAFFKGILTTILATPCSGPFLGPVFGFTIGQGVAVTYLIFFFVGLGMSMPYLLIGAFPSLVQWIPKPGMWMETFKEFMAFVLLGTVVYLLSTISADQFIPTMALLVAIWFACWLGGRQPITAPAATRWGSWLAGIATATLVGYVGFVGIGSHEEYELPWQSFSVEQLAESRESGNVVLVEFTANWCPTCQTNLLFAIDTQAVKQVVDANGVEAIKADYTDYDPEIKQLIKQLRSRSIPLLAVYPADRPQEVIVLRDTVSKSQVLQALAVAGATEENPHRNYRLDTPEEPADDDDERLAQRP